MKCNNEFSILNIQCIIGIWMKRSLRHILSHRLVTIIVIVYILIVAKDV